MKPSCFETGVPEVSTTIPRSVLPFRNMTSTRAVGFDSVSSTACRANTWHQPFFFSDLTGLLEHLEPYERV